jgi:FKBP-type peptidyl-prolyl cis-trans isomerase
MARRIEILIDEPGDGTPAVRGSRLQVYFQGQLRRGDPLQESHVTTFTLGAREVIAGLEYGVEGMRVGGRRRVRVPPHLAYGNRGVPGRVPKNALLVLDLELLSAEPPR